MRQKLFKAFLPVLAVAFCSCAVFAQQKSVALIAADNTASTQNYLDLAETVMADTFRFSDAELVKQALRASPKQDLFNLARDEAKNIGTRIGCDLILLARSENLRRSATAREIYFQSYAVLFLVNARTGDLIEWKFLTADADDAAGADKKLTGLLTSYFPSIAGTARNLPAAAIFPESLYEINEQTGGEMRTPLPFRRISPASTELAKDLHVEAVVDIEVAIDDKGYVTQTRIARWAGFGLDDSVTAAVQKMNFRPALRGGRPLAARFLLRYNFRVPAPAKESD